ncbi:MAG: HTTM domain-containing protein [Polyangiaceae bacterium]
MSEPPAPSPPTLRDRLEAAYLAFLARPTDGSAASLFRLTFGALAVWQAVGVLINLRRFWGRDALIPFEVVSHDPFIWLSPFAWAPNSAVVLYGHAAAVAISAVAFFVGFRPRPFALLLAAAIASLQFRNPFILNSGDRLFMIVAALSAAAPLSRRFSVDAWLALRAPETKPAPIATVWGQRLVGMQVAYVYLSSAVAKLGNPRWQQGRALRDVLASPVYAEWPRYVDSRVLIAVMTYGTLVFELLFPGLVWFKRFRPYLIAAGVVFHLGIDVTMIIPIFSWIMIASYPIYLGDDEVAWLLGRLPFVRGRSARRDPDPGS